MKASKELFRLSEDEADLMHLYRMNTPEGKAALLALAMLQANSLLDQVDNVVYLSSLLTG